MKSQSKFFFSIVLACLVLISYKGYSQLKYAVYFTDKNQVEFNPETYFSPKAIERRLKHNIPLNHISDYPLNQNYVAVIRQNCDSIKGVSRWLNAVFVYANNAQIEEIEKLNFVKNVELLGNYQVALAANDSNVMLPENGLPVLSQTDQVKRFNAGFFEQQNIDGKNVVIAVFDAGFNSVNKHPAFSHVFERNGILKTFDFIKNTEEVYHGGTHGTMVLSNICGIDNGKKLGLATGANFLLARTEFTYFEPFSEEENWLMAAEWADKNGADIINSSLGYTKKRYNTNQMDGKTSLVSKAAKIAISKGILVVNSVGNDGHKSWEIIVTPADVDSVLSVGGIDPSSDVHIFFSSYGPTANNKRKPNVVAFGKTITAVSNSSIKSAFGTSFSSPLVTGFAACALQLHPSYTNMQLFKEIERSGHLYPYFDYAHGYGVPQADYFTGNKKPVKPTFEIDKNEKELVVKLLINYSETTINEPYESYMFYHLEDSKGILRKYKVIKVSSTTPLTISIDTLIKYRILRIHYKGYTLSVDL